MPSLQLVERSLQTITRCVHASAADLRWAHQVSTMAQRDTPVGSPDLAHDSVNISAFTFSDKRCHATYSIARSAEDLEQYQALAKETASAICH
jgi:hypothetical protein